MAGPDSPEKASILLVINAGSSSIKFASYYMTDCGELLADVQGQIENIGNNPRFSVKRADGCVLAENDFSGTAGLGFNEGVAMICRWLQHYSKALTILAVGHRVVHGGSRCTAPVIVNDEIIQYLEQLIPLAALHQPHNLAGIKAFQVLMPDVPQVACFDTAFHSSQPEMACQFGLPKRFHEDGVKRYGFHGLSYDYLSRTLPVLDPKLTDARVIAAHLGSGASLCAMRNGHSVATTMGFSVLDGLIMGTRCGSLDPGVILHLINEYRLDSKKLERLLYHESGLLGLSGISNDMKTLLASQHDDAKKAIELFVYRISREIGSLAAALGGLDALVFTGGIGEHSTAIRTAVCEKAAWLGVRLDAAKTGEETVSGRISPNDSPVAVWVVPTDENMMIARHAFQLLTEAPASGN
jgi:acetate kinase